MAGYATLLDRLIRSRVTVCRLAGADECVTGHLVADQRSVLVEYRNWMVTEKSVLIRPDAEDSATSFEAVIFIRTGREMAPGQIPMVLVFDRTLPGDPLPVGAHAPRIGEPLFGLAPRDDTPSDPRDGLHLLAVSVVGFDRDGFSIVGGQPRAYSPLLNEGGQVLGVSINQDFDHCLYPRALFDTEIPYREPKPPEKPGARKRPAPRRKVRHRIEIDHAFGLKLGADGGGLVEKAQGAFSLALEYGTLFDEDWGLLWRFGAGFHSGSRVIRFRTGPDDRAGAVLGQPYELRLNVEAQYALPIRRSWKGAWFGIHFSLGVTAGGRMYRPQGMARVASQDCDPTSAQCPVTLTDPDRHLGEAARFALGPVVGLDVVLTPIQIGYRYSPGVLSLGQDDAHFVSIGLWFDTEHRW